MNAHTAVDQDLVDMLDAVFARHREEHEPGAEWDRSLWARLGELGLTRLTGREESGGSGATWFEAAELLRAPCPTVYARRSQNTTCSRVGYWTWRDCLSTIHGAQCVRSTTRGWHELCLGPPKLTASQWCGALEILTWSTTSQPPNCEL